MKRSSLLTKFLVIIGTVLAWIPILAPILLSIILFFKEGRFLLDYLMPAELFLFALVGGGLLLWASLRARRWYWFIGGSLGAAIFLLLSGQLFAQVSGLASGRIGPSGWQWILVLASLALFSIALITMGIGGIMLSRYSFRSKR